jgi:hypothetical protein
LGKERRKEWLWSPRGKLQFQNVKEDGVSKISSCSQKHLLQKMFGGFCKVRSMGAVIKDKYLAPNSIEDWVRTPIKKSLNALIIWKETTLAFPLIGKWLVWHVGKGDKV